MLYIFHRSLYKNIFEYHNKDQVTVDTLILHIIEHDPVEIELVKLCYRSYQVNLSSSGFCNASPT